MEDKKTVVVTIRLSENEMKPFTTAIKNLGIKRSEFFRSILLNNFDPNKHDKSRKNSLDKLLFYANKASNNLNQIARALNIFVMKGGITEQEKIKVFNQLDLIIELLKENTDEKK